MRSATGSAVHSQEPRAKSQEKYLITFQRHFHLRYGESREIPMTDAANRAQMHVRLSRFLKYQPLNLAVHPKVIDETLDVAMGNGWKDAEWLATYALEGCGHPSVINPAAVFVSRLREAAAMPCPVDATPQPPSVDELRRAGIIRERGTGMVPDRLRAALGLAARRGR